MRRRYAESEMLNKLMDLTGKYDRKTGLGINPKVRLNSKHLAGKITTGCPGASKGPLPRK